MKQRVRLVIYGRVQGVCYRIYAREEAMRLGLTGWVRNRSDGSVEAVAEGQRTALMCFRDWCGSGPPHAHVSEVTDQFSEASDEYESFVIA